MDDDLPFSLPPVDPAASAVPTASLTPELLAGLLADGDDELAAWALRHALEESTRAGVYDGLLRQAMTLVGERWQRGEWSIAEEHLASRTLLRALERIGPELGPEHRVGPVAVLAGVSGEQHMIGLVCLEQVLAEAGWTVANLGADLPAEDLRVFVARNVPDLVALTASDTGRLDRLAQDVQAVREASAGRHVPVIVGGRIAGWPGVGEAVGADAVTTTIAQALAFAEAHRPDDGGTAPA